MSLSPEDIRTQQFRKSFRGADAGEVASFLDRVASDTEGILRDLASEQEKVAGLEQRLDEYRTIEKILQQTLLQAQETATRSVDNARRESELLLQQTEIQAAEMLNQARRDLTGIKEQITILLAKKDYIISRLKQLLSAQMDTMSSLEGDPDFSTPPQHSASGQTAQGSELDDILKNIE